MYGVQGNMNVLFINPYMPIDDRLTIRHPPLGIGYLSTALKKAGHSVSFLDLTLLRKEQGASMIKDFLESHDDVFVGITCVTQSYAIALSIAADIKRLAPSVSVMMGGPHVTFTAEEIEDNHISKVLQKGYKLNDKVIRPSMVAVVRK